MLISDNAKKFEIRRMMREERTKKPFKRMLLEAGTGILITAAILGTPLCSHKDRQKVGMEEIRKTAQRSHENAEIKVSEVDDVCAVGCKSGEGPFYWRKEAYEVDFSEGINYRKEFYDVYGILIMKGIGEESERFFLNPNWKGKIKVVQAIKTGDGWMPLSEFEGETAREVWEKAEERYKEK